MTLYWWSHWFWITFLINNLLVVPPAHTYPSADNISNNRNIKKDIKLLHIANSETVGILASPTALSSDNHVIPLNKPGENTTAENVSKNIPMPIALSSSFADFGFRSENNNKTNNNNINNNNKNNSGNNDQNNNTDYNINTEKIRKVKENITISISSGDHSRNVISKYDGEKVPPILINEVENRSVIVNQEILPSQTNGSDSKNSSTFEKKHLDLINNCSINNYSNFSSLSTNVSTNATTLTSLGEKSSSLLKQHPTSSPTFPIVTNNRTQDSRNSWMKNNLIKTTNSIKKSSNEKEYEDEHKIPFTLENANKQEELLQAESEHRSRKSKVLSAEYNHISPFINFSTDSKNVLTRSAASTVNQFDDHDEGNISSEALSVRRTYFLNAGTISAICFAIFGICAAVSVVGIVLYRRRYLNKPQALSEPDSCVYIDDSTLRDNSDEMYSLDNDSFLNSLEAMTIQNYWTDTVKHTKL